MTNPESKRHEVETAKENLQELGVGELTARIAWICAETSLSVNKTWIGTEPPYNSRESHVNYLVRKGKSEMAPYIEELNRRFPVTS